MVRTFQRVPLRRLPDWQPRLAELVRQRMRCPFAWGRHDCALFAADAVLAVTGVDLAADLRGVYATAGEAAGLLARHGGLAGLCVQRLGDVVPAALAQLGDIGLAQLGDSQSLVVCGGAHFLGAGRAGLQPVPLAAVQRVWRCTGLVNG